MAEFDRMLLEQQRELEEKQNREPLPERGTGGGGAEAREGSSAGTGTAPKGDDRTAAERRADAEAEARGRDEAGRTGGQGAGTSGEGAGDRTDATAGTGADGRRGGGAATPAEAGSDAPATAVPADLGDGKDDDVVARQMREAAMKEKDPAIRERLWEEYRRYKKETAGGSALRP